MATSPHLLLAYDDSAPADTAIRVVGALFPGAATDVLTAHPEPLSIDRVSRSAGGLVPSSVTASGLERLDQEMLTAAQATADRGAERARAAGLEVTSVTLAGGSRPWRTILDHAATTTPDAIVCGGRGDGAIARAVLGSTAEALLQNADRPVLVVPDGVEAQDGPIVVAYDGSQGARAAVTALARLAPGRDVVVVTAWESLTDNALPGLAGLPVPSMREMAGELDAIGQDEASRIARDGVDLATSLGLRAEPLTLRTRGNPRRAIAEAAAERSAAAVVAGSRGQGRLASLLLGSVSSGLVHNADRPTLIIP